MSAAQPPHASGRPPPEEPAPRGRNPLIRTSDRVEAWFRRALLLVLVAGMPLAAIAAGTAAYERAMHTVRVQAADRQQVSAELISGTVDAYHGAKQQAQVRWSEEDGTVRTGTALVDADTPKGATVKVWVDRDGYVTSPPMTDMQAVTNASFTGGLTALGVVAATSAAQTLLRAALDRRRYAQWEAEWSAVEPEWAARFHR
ncbi:hypothetical protein GCM10009535_02790 [Streptomyces thermocarboxydovorans]|uniref:Uncharacterized protein n=1 Tax=Streptomyces thermocarboxydovorans TaxID=59298 RepID=A0ABN1H6Z5_9ACTN